MTLDRLVLQGLLVLVRLLLKDADFQGLLAEGEDREDGRYDGADSEDRGRYGGELGGKVARHRGHGTPVSGDR